MEDPYLEYKDKDKDEDGYTPLCYTVIQGNMPVMNILIDYGAKVEYALGDTALEIAKKDWQH
jgi:ankyrin repeat protein